MENIGLLLNIDFEAILTLAGVMSIGVFLTVQTLKVLTILRNELATGIAAIIAATVLGVLAGVSYLYPEYAVLISIFYSIVLAADIAALFYKYLAKPFFNKIAGEDVMSAEALNE